MSSNKLPNGWSFTGLEGISDLKKSSIKRGPFGSALKKAFFVKDGYKVYEQQNVIKNDFTRGTYFIDDEKYEELKAFTIKPNDILMSCAGTVGKLAIVPDNIPTGVINQALFKLSVHPSINLQYFFKLFSYKIEEILRENTRGSAMVNLTSVKDLKEVKFPIAPINEQKRIVEKIEKLFANLDNSDKHLAHLEKQLKRYRQSVLKSAFEGELTREWRDEQSDLETTNELLEKIKIERIEYIEQEVRKKFKDKTEKWIADKVKKELDKFYNGLKQIEDKEKPYNIPKEWNWVRLDELSKKITDGTHHTPTYASEGISFISVKDIRNKKINFENCKYISAEEHHELYKRCNPENNDVLITKSGTIGRSCVVQVDRDFSLFVSVALIKPFLNLLNPYYLMYRLDNYIFMTDIQQTIKGGVIKNLHIVDMRQLVFPLLSTKEQNEIVKQIEKHFSIIDKLESVVQKSITESKRLRQSILKQAFEGKLVEQDPNDESAEELLKKIAKAKEEYKKATAKKRKNNG